MACIRRVLRCDELEPAEEHAVRIESMLNQKSFAIVPIW